MGIKTAPDIFQEKMMELMSGLDFVRTYLDDLLILSCGSFDDHTTRLNSVLARLRRAGLKLHLKKSTFAKGMVEYLGYVITRQGIMPQLSKITAIRNLKVPTNVREVRKILGLVQYYRDIWPRRSHTLAPLTELVSTKNVSENEKKIGSVK